MIERGLVGRPQRGRLLVVSHACVLPVNQHVYTRLAELGWDLTLVVPAYWNHEYQAHAFESRALPELESRFIRFPVVLAGRPQRHIYRVRVTHFLRKIRPDVAFFEEETFSLPALQWGFAADRANTPFGVQAAENLERPLPRVARAARRWTLRQAAFVAARSPAAGDLARRWGALGAIPVVPHAIPDWNPSPRTSRRPFTIGFAGRLVAEKGIWDLVEATGALEPPIRLLLVGDGPLRRDLEHVSLPNGGIEIWSDVGHEGMPRAYGEMDVLALPSRTTDQWVEQFGRVLVEALFCGVPVVGSDSGEIPWVISVTRGGRVFPEGDSQRLADVLTELRAQPRESAELAARGRDSAVQRFGLGAVAAALDQALLDALEQRSDATRIASPQRRQMAGSAGTAA
jgi:glycosyltransferase involved in cell wall biosynthesis